MGSFPLDGCYRFAVRDRPDGLRYKFIYKYAVGARPRRRASATDV